MARREDAEMVRLMQNPDFIVFLDRHLRRVQGECARQIATPDQVNPLIYSGAVYGIQKVIDFCEGFDNTRKENTEP